MTWSPDPAWARSEKVRVDSLRIGVRFRCISGHTWTFRGLVGGSAGAYRTERTDGLMSCFAGCAEVAVVEVSS